MEDPHYGLKGKEMKMKMNSGDGGGGEELQVKLDEHKRKLRYQLGICSTQEMKEMSEEQLDEYFRSSDEYKRKLLDWRDGMLAIHSKIVSHKNEYKHEGCCMHLIESILLDYGFLNACDDDDTE